MCRAEKLRDVPHVAVLRRHVEVAANDHRVVRRRGRREVVTKAAEPRKLEVVLLAADRATVRHVDARDPNPAAARREHAALLDLFGELSRKAGPYLFDPHPGQDGDAVPAAVAVMGRLVAERRECHGGESGVGHLRLLQADDVGPRVREPVLELAEAGLQRVDIPGRDAHPDSVARRRPGCNVARCRVLGTGAPRRSSAARGLPGPHQGIDGQLIDWAPELTGKLPVLVVPHTTKPTTFHTVSVACSRCGGFRYESRRS